MKLKIFTLLCCLLTVSSIEGRVSNRNVALLVVECEAKNGLCQTQHLIRYRFRNGVQVSRDIILTAPTDRVRYDLGQNHLFQNRYVITNWGDIIDVQTKNLLHEGVGEYIGIDGSRIIQRIKKMGVDGFLSYDLKSNQYSRLKFPGKWALPGLLSPDQTKSVVSESGSNEIRLHHLNGKKKLLGSGFKVRLSESCCDFPKPPVLWLDNDRILTQRSNGEIVILRMDGIIEPLVKIPIAEPSSSLPQLYRNSEGRIIYVCSGEAYILDVENKKYAPYEWQSLGYGFESERYVNPKYGQIVRYHGKEIGRSWSCCAKTTNGLVALVYGEVGSNLGYPKGVKVWNDINNEWITIDAKWLNTIIGWMEE